MKMTFRWYGYYDKNTLAYIRQIPGVSGVVTALYTVPVGDVWPYDEVKALKEYVNSYDLEMEVIESVPVSEDIKLRRGDYKRHIESFKENIRILSKVGVKCICYNFMPVFDWTRSQLEHITKDGSKVLAYYKDDIEKLDPTKMSLPGWDSSYKPEEIKELIDAYQKLGEEGLWNNLKLFLEEIIPVAEECDVLMAIHPDDPAWPIFGIPRIITCEENIDRFLKLVDNHYNGLTLCSGSLGTREDNDMVHLINKYGKMDRIHFAHLRNIKIVGEQSFEETAHFSECGTLDMVKMVKAYHDLGYKKYIRPDHGRTIWDENAKHGYGLFDRALGAMYINGIWETLDKVNK
ncbi:MAG: mannonate dehydratase [Acholeplasmatales bacterium]|nr:mannonate dehydratase [Acholeplasmatales bacterium]